MPMVSFRCSMYIVVSVYVLVILDVSSRSHSMWRLLFQMVFNCLCKTIFIILVFLAAFSWSELAL